MVNVTIAVPKELKDKLDERPEMNWSEVARQAWKKKTDELDLLDKLTENSKATDEDIEEISKRVKRGIREWHDARLAKK